MRPSFVTAALVAAALPLVAAGAPAQEPAPPPAAQSSAAQAGAEPEKTRRPGFFDAETPLEITLTTNLKQIRGDKRDQAPWRPATVTFAGPDGAPKTVPVQIRTRGNWRLKNCHFPPIRMNFVKDSVKGTALARLDKPKLVNYCRDDDPSEQYVLQEYQLYRIYNLLTPHSQRARLLRTTYKDQESGKVLTTRWAFVIEEPEVMAERTGTTLVEEKGATVNDLDHKAMAFVGLYQYLIANTDFSIGALHNIELLRDKVGNHYPVAYDFDHAGAVNARYAVPNEKLPIRSVRQRLFRGYCVSPESYEPAVALFNEKKDAIYALYSDDIGKLMSPKVAKETLEYFDDFYEKINDPRALKRDIVDACVK